MNCNIALLDLLLKALVAADLKRTYFRLLFMLMLKR